MNFTAMDFETANRHYDSACSLALGLVRENKIIDSVYTVINRQIPLEY